MDESIINKAINGWDYQCSDQIFYQSGYYYDYVSEMLDISEYPDKTVILLKLISGKTAQLALSATGEETLYFEFMPPIGVSEMPAFYLKASDLPRHSMKVKETESRVALTWKKLHIEMTRQPFSLCVKQGSKTFALSGKKVSRQFITPGLGLRIDGQGNAEAFISWEIKNGDKFYGLGEKFGKVEKSQTRTTSYVMDACGTNATDLSYKAHPLLLSTAGYGLLLATARRTQWEIGHFCFESASALSESAMLRGYLFFADSLKGLVQLQAQLQGKPDMPVPWTLGVWYSRCAYQNTQELLEVQSGLAQHQLPYDVLHLDVNWGKHYWYKDFWVDCCDFEWGNTRFPQPEVLFQQLEDENVACSVWINPYLPPGTQAYREACEKGYLVKNSDGGIAHIYRRNVSEIGIPDLTHPGAYQWWKEHLKTLLRRGIKALKPDYGDRIPADALFHNGFTGKDMHNAYIFLYTKVCYEATQEVHGTALVWKRPSFLGCGRFAGTWSGDVESSFEGLQHTLRGGLSVGFSGECFWSSDIAGFKGKEVPVELYIRWSQVGLLCSLARYHGVSPREPWHFGQQAVDVVRRYSQLRYQWMPYLLMLAAQAQQQGLPVMRHLGLVFEQDAMAHTIDDQFMLGDAIMVVPVLQPLQTQRDVYLPAGCWYSVHEKQWFEGRRIITVDLTLDDIPLFIREGSIIPTFDTSPLHLKSFNHLAITLMVYGKSTESNGILVDEQRKIYAYVITGKEITTDYPAPVSVAII